MATPTKKWKHVKAMKIETVESVPCIQAPLTGGHGIGKVALIDVDDYIKFGLSKRSMYVDTHGYVRLRYEGKTVYLHRLILGLESVDKMSDHINHETLDNRKSNLRAVNKTQNNRNRRPQKNGIGLKGVGNFRGMYRARIARPSDPSKRVVHLGVFETKEEAAYAYNIASHMLHQEYCYQNDITESHIPASTRLRIKQDVEERVTPYL